MSRSEWQTPPGWPLPLKGWAPPPGWQPDPSWPSPPADWIWWREGPRKRRKRLQLWLIIGTPVLVSLLVVGSPVGLLVAAEVYASMTGCGSVDPTDPNNFSDVTLLNDTADTIIIDSCSGAYCRAYDLPVQLKPGQAHQDHAACAASGKDMSSWRVRTVDGKLLGYIAVDTPRKQDGLVFRISQSSRDRASATPQSN